VEYQKQDKTGYTFPGKVPGYQVTGQGAAVAHTMHDDSQRELISVGGSVILTAYGIMLFILREVSGSKIYAITRPVPVGLYEMRIYLSAVVIIIKWIHGLVSIKGWRLFSQDNKFKASSAGLFSRTLFLKKCFICFLLKVGYLFQEF
jgi:hypothetical protein